MLEQWRQPAFTGSSAEPAMYKEGLRFSVNAEPRMHIEGKL
jgi:hypothetical protein